MNKIQVVYISKATQDFDDAALRKILDDSARNNPQANITGMLLYTQKTFLQVLEGDATIVDALINKIQSDPRHHSVEIVIRSSIREREFNNWSMGYRRLQASDAEAMPHFAPFFEAGFDAEKIGVQPGIALDILREMAAQLDGA